MEEADRFPIQGDGSRNKPPTTIPWWLAEVAYKEYVSLFGGTQSLQRLAERGGFCREELVGLLSGRYRSDRRAELPEDTP